MNDPEQAAHLLANAVVLLRGKNDAGMMSALREICAVQCEIITNQYSCYTCIEDMPSPMMRHGGASRHVVYDVTTSWIRYLLQHASLTGSAAQRQ